MYAHLPARTNGSRCLPLPLRFHLTPSFPFTSTLFPAMATSQVPYFQAFAHSFPSHGGGGPLLLAKSKPRIFLNAYTGALLNSYKCFPHKSDELTHVESSIRRGCESRATNGSRGTSLPTHVQANRSFKHKSDELTHVESHSYAKHPGEGAQTGCPPKPKVGSSEEFSLAHTTSQPPLTPQEGFSSLLFGPPSMRRSEGTTGNASPTAVLPAKPAQKRRKTDENR